MIDHRIPDLAAVRSPPRRELDYEVIREGEVIGSGGQAIIRRCELGDDTPSVVAVKEPLHPTKTIDSSQTETFLESAATWRRLDTKEREKRVFEDSEHIVGIVDLGDEVPWVAMEYMDGGSLSDRLDANPEGLPVDEALWIAERLCRGLEVAHDSGIAHLDLKPDNVLFRETTDDTWDVPKIGDWGLARVLIEESATLDAYSIEYAAPEHFDSDLGSTDKYSDIYQLGALVYAMLTGRPPHTGSQAEVMYDVVHGEEPTPPTELRADLPDAVDKVVLTALSREKSDRYRGKIDRFGDALQAIRGELITESESDESEWAMFRGDPARTGYKPTGSGPQRQVVPLWTYQTDGDVPSSPAVVNGTVYIGSEDGGVYSLDARTGELQWRFETGAPVISSPAVAGGIVYIESGGQLYAISEGSGDKLWSQDVVDEVDDRDDVPAISSPAVIDDTVYVGSLDHHLYAVAASTGEKQWRFETNQPIGASPAVVGGTVYIGSTDQYIYAVDVDSGKEEWSTKLSQKIISSPAAIDDCIYIGTGELPTEAPSAAIKSDWRDLLALDANDGSRCWNYQKNGMISSPAVSNTSVFVAGTRGDVTAIDINTGDKQWTYRRTGHIFSSPAVVGDTVYVGDINGLIYALDADSGDLRWTFALDTSIHSSPAVVDDTIFMGANDGQIYAFEEWSN
jgi:outer membrane protein assembly factor BamB